MSKAIVGWCTARCEWQGENGEQMSDQPPISISVHNEQDALSIFKSVFTANSRGQLIFTVFTKKTFTTKAYMFVNN